MILYHGTIHDFTDIDVKRGKPFKDFGCGFYLSAVRQHALALAERNYQIKCSRLGEKERRNISKWLYSYEFSPSALAALSVKEFAVADREWIRFVIMNRSSRTATHSYDIVIGPTANDQTSSVLQIYLSGGYGEIGSDSALDILSKMIIPDKLPRQYFFGTQTAARHLNFIQKESL